MAQLQAKSLNPRALPFLPCYGGKGSPPPPPALQQQGYFPPVEEKAAAHPEFSYLCGVLYNPSTQFHKLYCNIAVLPPPQSPLPLLPLQYQNLSSVFSSVLESSSIIHGDYKLDQNDSGASPVLASPLCSFGTAAGVQGEAVAKKGRGRFKGKLQKKVTRPSRCGSIWKRKTMINGSCEERCGSPKYSLLPGITTVMMRNIPNRLARKDLMDLLDDHCKCENEKARLDPDPLLSAYDFLYLPMDFKTHSNLGYAFVNFTTGAAAVRFVRSYNNYKWAISKKVCEITPAKIQGAEALRKQFQQSCFTCDTEEYLPLEFSPPRDGDRTASDVRITVVGKCVGACPRRNLSTKKTLLLP